jgi:undecaprenyl-diphosphatase
MERQLNRFIFLHNYRISGGKLNLIMQKTPSSIAPALTGVRSRPAFAIFASVTAILCILLVFAGYVQPVVMGIVQGLGEFLPISSSAHLILVPWFFNWRGGVIDSLTFDVALHLGTLVALLGYFWREWIELLRAVPGALMWALRRLRGAPTDPPTQSEQLLSAIIIATIPGAVFGVLLDRLAESSLRSPLLIAMTLAIMGVLLYLADHRRPQSKALDQISLRDALLIGLSQACALIPGVSRSGATITMGRWLKVDRVSAARFSFLMSAPITAAAVLFKLKDILRIPPGEANVFLIGVLVSAAVGALAIRFLLNYVRQIGFGGFAAYRVALALVVLLVYFLRA